MIIGLTGRNAAGKGTAAEYLVELGFEYHSLSDAIRDVLSGRGEAPTRERMIAAGRELRESGGPGALAKQILSKLKPGNRYVVDSFRNPGEVEVFRDCGRRFVLIEVQADEHVRFERLRSRGRVGDAETIEEFRKHESAELTGNAVGQQLLATAELADAQVDNDTDISALRVGIDLILNTVQS
jgi:dephospho-CoA kinase